MMLYLTSPKAHLKKKTAGSPSYPLFTINSLILVVYGCLLRSLDIKTVPAGQGYPLPGSLTYVLYDYAFDVPKLLHTGQAAAKLAKYI